MNATDGETGSWEVAAQAAYLSGRYVRFLETLQERPAETISARFRLHASKALSRLGRPQEALAQIKLVAEAPGSEVAALVQAALQQSVIERLVGSGEGARACIAFARRLVASANDPEAESLVRLYEALQAWTERDFAATEAFARGAMSSLQPETLALAGQFLGFVAASRGRYMEQIAMLESALAELDTEPVHDLWIDASILENISGIIADLYLPAVARRMSDRAEALDWSKEMGVQRHHIMRSLAYFRSLGSDPFLPFEYLDRAAELAPTEAWSLVSRLDRIFLVQEMSGDRIAQDFDLAAEIQRAEEIASTIDWAEADGEERFGLLLLAEILAERRPNDAAVYLALSRKLQQTMSPILMGKSDERWAATEGFVEGIIAAANGQLERAVELIGNAFAFWNDVGYSWRATRAAIKLYELTGDERHIAWAFRESRRYPYSWLSDAVSRAGHRRT